MRLFAPLLLVGLAGAMTATPADACPQGALCVAVDFERTEIAAPAPARRVAVALRVQLAAPADPPPSLRFSAPRASTESRDSMPWIWSALRARVYSQLPSQRSESLTLTLAPVVVKGQYDTIPGVGVAGDF